MQITKLSIIIPAYNEGPTIHLILDKLQKVQLENNIEKEIIIINDFSKDNTEEDIFNYISNNNDLKSQYFNHEL